MKTIKRIFAIASLPVSHHHSFMDNLKITGARLAAGIIVALCVAGVVVLIGEIF
jgi:hypothetical protein